MLQRMLIGCMVVFFQQLSGQNSLLYYIPTLLKVLGFPSNQVATLATIGVGANKFIFSLITLFTIDKIGRRPLLLTGITLLAVSMFSLGCLSVIFIDPGLVLSTSPAVQLSNCTTLLNQLEYVLPSKCPYLFKNKPYSSLPSGRLGFCLCYTWLLIRYVSGV